MARRNSRKEREVRALDKLIAAGAADLVVAVSKGELTADEAYQQYLDRKERR